MVKVYSENILSDFKGSIIDLETIGNFLNYEDSRRYKNIIPVIFGFIVTLTLIFLSCFITALITSLTWAIDFVPVQTRFPDEKTRTADFGSLTLRTNPGKVSGLYSVFG